MPMPMPILRLTGLLSQVMHEWRDTGVDKEAKDEGLEGNKEEARGRRGRGEGREERR